MLRADWIRRTLRFNFEARTSRAVMHTKDTYFVRVYDSDSPDIYGLGEVPLFRGLSAEDDSDFEYRLDSVCRNLSFREADSCVRMGFETALADLANGARGIIIPGTEWLGGDMGIAINGLIWMGDRETMSRRIKAKIDEGFRCLKLKIGGIDFEEELGLLKYIRSRFPADVLELRADANGAFTPADALSRLERLSKFSLHSIEQPIKAGQHAEMARICRESPVPIALDEDLIGITPADVKRRMLALTRPRYIILKPALCGGFAEADDWIAAAQEQGIGWWATSALESNVGLNAIAQWTATHDVVMPQGLGTGELYADNTASQLIRRGQLLYFDPGAKRDDKVFES